MPNLTSVILSSGSGSGFSEALSAVKLFCVNYGFRLVGALIVLFVGLWLAGLIVRLMRKSRWFGRIDRDVQGFAASAVKALLYVLVTVTAIAIMGVPMASIVAVIASCGVAIGLALQGSLSNLAGGLMLILFKPFHVGDYISANGHEGTVEEIGIFATKLVTIDNRRVVLPNAQLSNSTLVNSTSFDVRRVDHVFRADIEADSERVIGVLRSMAEAQEKRLPDREPEVRFDSFGDGFAKYHVRVWCRTEDYWELYYALLEAGKKALEANGIKIPVPQVEVHGK